MKFHVHRTRGAASFVVLLSMLGLIAGCGKSLPPGMPEVFPCSVEVVDAGTPVESVQVVFYPDESLQNTTVFAETDVTGAAVVQTRYSGAIVDGAPVGTYKVTLNKQHVIEHTKTEAERAAMSDAEMAAYGAEREKQRQALGEIVPEALTTLDSTPLTVEVTSDGAAKLSVDLSEY